MARAYKKMYLDEAMRNLAVMMDCGVRKYGYPIEEVIAMYYPLHEADISKFVDAADNIVERN